MCYLLHVQKKCVALNLDLRIFDVQIKMKIIRYSSPHTMKFRLWKYKKYFQLWKRSEERCKKRLYTPRSDNKIMTTKIFTNSFNENAICMRWAEKNNWSEMMMSWNEEQVKKSTSFFINLKNIDKNESIVETRSYSERVNEWRVIVMIIQIDEPYCGQKDTHSSLFTFLCTN